MKTLFHFRDFVKEITSSNSRKYKQEVLQKYKDNFVIREYLKFAFDPYIQFGVGRKKLAKELPTCTHAYNMTTIGLLEYLQIHNTGSDYDVAHAQTVVARVRQTDPEAADLLENIICKDLSIGCDAKTINSVISNLIPTFNVMLANKYFDKPEIVEGAEFAITTKIDGGRIIAIKENGQVSFYTRAGQKYEGLVDLEREMLEKLPDNICLDGEITLLDSTGIPSKEAYKRTMQITRKDGPKTGVKMLVFDAMRASEFKAQYCTHTWEYRRFALNQIFDSRDDLTYFELLPVLYQGTDTSMILKLLDEAIANNEEGVMINFTKKPYEFKRSNVLLKVKKMNTLDLQIIGFEEGEGRLTGTLGAILVRYKHGNTVKVGSGFSDLLRTQIWANQEKYLYSICEIQYFEETTNADGGISLRFPIFKDFRDPWDKNTPDF